MIRHTDGFRGVWYMNQPQKDQFKYKYSGGLATYPQQLAPIAVYSPKANKTFFTFGASAGKIGKGLLDAVSFFDHATGEVANPVVLVERPSNDAHCNPTLALDYGGRIWVFCNAHGTGAPAYIYRSREPFSIEAFDLVREENFSYSQVWPVQGQGLVWISTHYNDGRRRVFSSLIDPAGPTFSEPKQLLDIELGSYAISWSDGKRVFLAADYHPRPGGLNARTNIYFLQTSDAGQTWANVRGEAQALPINTPDNPALIHDFARERTLVYLKDVTFDAEGNPVILFLSSHGHQSGSESDPRIWQTARWTGKDWVFREIQRADHNYDHGSLYIEPDGAWRLIAPTAPGPQPSTTGGQIEVQLSHDQGMTWKKLQSFDVQSGRNQTYIRRPLNASSDFYALWADGDSLNVSESDLYFCNQAGSVFRLPREISGQRGRPEPVLR